MAEELLGGIMGRGYKIFPRGKSFRDNWEATFLPTKSKPPECPNCKSHRFASIDNPIYEYQCEDCYTLYNPSKAGYTLLELFVVLGIVGLLCAIYAKAGVEVIMRVKELLGV